MHFGRNLSSQMPRRLAARRHAQNADCRAQAMVDGQPAVCSVMMGVVHNDCQLTLTRL